jgi:hypothetical protein
LAGVVDERDRGLLVAARVGAQYPQPGAVVDGGELVELAPPALLAERLDELHVDLQLVARALLLVASPTAVVALVALGGRESVHLESFQDPPHPGVADRHVVIAGEVHGDLGRAEVVLLAQPDDLLDHLGPGHPRRAVRPAGTFLQSVQAGGLVTAPPAVVALAADAVIAAGRRHVAAHLLDMTQHRKLALGPSLQLTFSHGDPLDLGDPTVNNLRHF